MRARTTVAALVLLASARAVALPSPTRGGEVGLLDVPDAEVMGAGRGLLGAELRFDRVTGQPARSGPLPAALVMGVGERLDLGLALREWGQPDDPLPSRPTFGAAAKLKLLASRSPLVPSIALGVTLDRFNAGPVAGARLVASTSSEAPVRLAAFGGLEGRRGPMGSPGVTAGAALAVWLFRPLEAIVEVAGGPRGANLGAAVRASVKPTVALQLALNYLPSDDGLRVSLGIALGSPPREPQAAPPATATVEAAPQQPAPVSEPAFDGPRPRFRLKLRRAGASPRADVAAARATPLEPPVSGEPIVPRAAATATPVALAVVTAGASSAPPGAAQRSAAPTPTPSSSVVASADREPALESSAPATIVAAPAEPIAPELPAREPAAAERRAVPSAPGAFASGAARARATEPLAATATPPREGPPTTSASKSSAAPPSPAIVAAAPVEAVARADHGTAPAPVETTGAGEKERTIVGPAAAESSAPALAPASDGPAETHRAPVSAPRAAATPVAAGDLPSAAAEREPTRGETLSGALRNDRTAPAEGQRAPARQRAVAILERPARHAAAALESPALRAYPATASSRGVTTSRPPPARVPAVRIRAGASSALAPASSRPEPARAPRAAPASASAAPPAPSPMTAARPAPPVVRTVTSDIPLERIAEHGRVITFTLGLAPLHDIDREGLREIAEMSAREGTPVYVWTCSRGRARDGHGETRSRVPLASAAAQVVTQLVVEGRVTVDELVAALRRSVQPGIELCASVFLPGEAPRAVELDSARPAGGAAR